MRIDKRSFHQIRDLIITPHISRYAEGSAEIQIGNTQVICTASVDHMVPKWIRSPGRGWVAAEYGMLPRSTHTRLRREKTHSSGRSQEISRLIGRSLRAGMDLKKLGERQIHIDCDVIQADGGSRTAAITGAFVALAVACQSLKKEVVIEHLPLKYYVAALRAGILDHQVSFDRCHEADQKADSDTNIVFASNGELIEIQSTAEVKTFSTKQLHETLNLTWAATQSLFREQEKIIGSFFPLVSIPSSIS